MFKKLNILDEKDPMLRKKSIPATFPLSKEDKNLIQGAIDELTYSQIEEYAEKYHLRIFDNYVFINPKIISNSEEMVAAEAGEGCLSVNREVEGHVPRYARVTVEGFDEDGNKIRCRAREDLAIAFQHEIDHLDGILFYDRIDPNKPFFTEMEMRLI